MTKHRGSRKVTWLTLADSYYTIALKVVCMLENVMMQLNCARRLKSYAGHLSRLEFLRARDSS